MVKYIRREKEKETGNEKFIHYQRLREAFYVLELSYIAARNNKKFLDVGIIKKTEN